MKKLPSIKDLEKASRSKRSRINDDGEVTELDEAWFKNASVVRPSRESISLRLDADVLAWYRAQGKGYQTRMQAVLAAYARAHPGKAAVRKTRG